MMIKLIPLIEVNIINPNYVFNIMIGEDWGDNINEAFLEIISPHIEYEAIIYSALERRMKVYIDKNRDNTDYLINNLYNLLKRLKISIDVENTNTSYIITFSLKDIEKFSKINKEDGN